MNVKREELKQFLDALIPTQIDISSVGLLSEVKMKYSKEKLEANQEQASRVIDALMAFNQSRGGHDLNKEYQSIKDQPIKLIDLVVMNSVLFGNLVKAYTSEMFMDDLKKGDAIVRTADGSRWEFSHYESTETSSGDNRNGDNLPTNNRSLLWAKRFDERTWQLDEASYQSFPVFEFKRL